MVLPVERERISGKPNVWEIVQQALILRGQETMSGLHKAYKEELKEFYANELKPFLTYSADKGRDVPYARLYRTRKGERQYIKRPPKGMTYLSFTRYINRWLNEGLIEKVGESKKTKLTPEQIEAGLKMPVYYRLK